MPIRILPLEVLLDEAHARGDLVYLHFQPAEIEGRTIRLTLQARIAPRDPQQRTLGLSGTQARFREVAGQWEALDEPILFAT